jgi:hypothetical protein
MSILPDDSRGSAYFADLLVLVIMYTSSHTIARPLPRSTVLVGVRR